MPGRLTPPDPNYKLYGQYGGKAKYEAAKTARDNAKITAKKIAGNTDTFYYKANEGLLVYLNESTYGLQRKLNDAKLANNGALVASLKAEIALTRAKIRDNSSKADLYLQTINDAQKDMQKKKVVNNNPTIKKEKIEDAYDGVWKFNAPMINNLASLEKGSLPKMISAGPALEGDAKDFWSALPRLSVNARGQLEYLNPEISNNSMGGKGTFQMDRQINTAAFKADSKKAAEAINRPFDPNYYGFKFHYNPTTLNMSWAGVRGANPMFEAANLDPAVPMSQNLFASTVNFAVVLNRIQDLAALDDFGNYRNGKNPYSVEVSRGDRLDIVQKGTMYDLEFLFRAMHGFAGSANYDSTLMGRTKDPGWLPVRPIELHLGKKLRYRVRVNNMEVNHKIFSSSMVPIFSEVSFSCMRYWDGPVGTDSKK